LQAGERSLLSICAAAGYAALRRSAHGAAGRAAARARTEIASLFAHRWAQLNRVPAPLRAAMAAALAAEQAAMLAARTRSIVDELEHQHRRDRTQLRTLYAAQRMALTARHRQTRASATAIGRRRDGGTPRL
jgi:predicted nucleotidyltransferase